MVAVTSNAAAPLLMVWGLTTSANNAADVEPGPLLGLPWQDRPRTAVGELGNCGRRSVAGSARADVHADVRSQMVAQEPEQLPAHVRNTSPSAQQ